MARTKHQPQDYVTAQQAWATSSELDEAERLMREYYEREDCPKCHGKNMIGKDGRCVLCHYDTHSADEAHYAETMATRASDYPF
jgi:hypothetical protein